MKYNKLYFLHIPKTGGRYISYNAIFPILDQLSDNGIEFIFLKHNSHSGWHSEIDEKTYVLTVLRDPVEQAISFYSHKIALMPTGKLKTKYDKDKLNKEDFFKWMKGEVSYPNFQSKNFLCNEFYLKKDHPKNKLNVDLIFDEDLLEKRKNKVNMFLDMKNINGREIEIQEKIFLDLGINGHTVSSNNQQELFNPESKKLYDKFTEKEKEFIRDYNSIDDYFYKNTKYF
jgi:hypothetical protein